MRNCFFIFFLVLSFTAVAQNKDCGTREPKKEGIQVGDMQKKLMEKVEELTLYIRDLQKSKLDELTEKK